MGNPIVHFEIAGCDGAALESFYSSLFDWAIERREIGGFPYGRVKTGAGQAFDGGIRHEPDGAPEVVLYVEVPDLEAAMARAKHLGATVRIPPMTAGEVTFGMILDPEGNPVGIVQQK
ncbi:MAG: VOC family protein [Planctomycetota bacterium]|jgi:predicted enzyme related to lactoylglutathione lyase